MDYSTVVSDIIKDYFDLLFYGTFGLSTLFLIFLFALSYRYKQIILLLSYMGAAAIPFCFGIASKYFHDSTLCSTGSCDQHAIVAFFVYFFVNGLLALSFWVIRSRQERAEAVAPVRATL